MEENQSANRSIGATGIGGECRRRRMLEPERMNHVESDSFKRGGGGGQRAIKAYLQVEFDAIGVCSEGFPN